MESLLVEVCAVSWHGLNGVKPGLGRNSSAGFPPFRPGCGALAFVYFVSFVVKDSRMGVPWCPLRLKWLSAPRAPHPDTPDHVLPDRSPPGNGNQTDEARPEQKHRMGHRRLKNVAVPHRPHQIADLALGVAVEVRGTAIERKHPAVIAGLRVAIHCVNPVRAIGLDSGSQLQRFVRAVEDRRARSTPSPAGNRWPDSVSAAVRLTPNA